MEDVYSCQVAPTNIYFSHLQLTTSPRIDLCFKEDHRTTGKEIGYDPVVLWSSLKQRAILNNLTRFKISQKSLWSCGPPPPSVFKKMLTGLCSSLKQSYSRAPSEFSKREIIGGWCILAKVNIFQKNLWSCGPLLPRVYFQKKYCLLVCGPVVLLEMESCCRACSEL